MVVGHCLLALPLLIPQPAARLVPIHVVGMVFLVAEAEDSQVPVHDLSGRGAVLGGEQLGIASVMGLEAGSMLDEAVMSDCSLRCFVQAGCGMFSALLLYWVVQHAACCHTRKLYYRMARSGAGSWALPGHIA